MERYIIEIMNFEIDALSGTRQITTGQANTDI